MATIRSVPPSGNIRAYVDCLKGFKSDINKWQDPIDATAKRGGHLTNLHGSENPGARLDFLDEDRERAKQLFCSDRPQENQTAMRIAAAHSLGGFLLSELLSEDETAASIGQNYDGVAIFNGFFGSKWMNVPFREQYAGRFHDFAVGTTPLERLFSSASKGRKSHELPTHPQGLMLDQEALKLIQKIKDNDGFSPELGDIPVMFITGDYDGVCSKKTVQDVIRITGASHKGFKVDHYAMNYPEVRNFFVEWGEELRTPHAPKRQAYQRQFVPVKQRKPRLGEIVGAGAAPAPA